MTRCTTRCDHDAQCTLLTDHGDRHETDHGCVCYNRSKHSPLPWRVKVPAPGDAWSVVDATGKTIVLTNNAADAELIVAAVNAHRALASAAELALQHCDDGADAVGLAASHDHVRATLRAALALARGKK